MKKDEVIALQESNKTRICNKCGLDVPFKNFFIKHTKGNPNSYRFNSPCKSCHNKSNINRVEYQRNYHLLKKFGLTIEDYYEMSTKQNNSCAICKTHIDLSKKKLAVDHCHSTGKIRSLLCVSCNAGLGLFKDDILLLKSAMKYLSKH